MLSSLLNTALTTIIIDVVGIIAIILIGAFLIALVADILLLFFDKNSNGIFFRRDAQKANEKRAKKSKESNVQPLVEQNATVTPLVSITDEAKQPKNEFEEEFHAIDFDKAVEEQKLLQQNKINLPGVKPLKEDKLFVAEGKNNFIAFDEEDFEEDEEDFEDEEDIAEIIKEVQKQAMKEIEEEDASKQKEKVTITTEQPIFVVEEEKVKEPEEEVKPEPKEQPKVENKQKSETIPTRRIATPKIIYKKVEEEVKPEQKEQPKVEVAKNTEYENYVLNEIRKIRDEIFDLRLNVFNEIYSSKDGKVSKTRKTQIEELEEEIIEKMRAINAMYTVNTALLNANLQEPKQIEKAEEVVEKPKEKEDQPEKQEKQVETITQYIEDTAKIKELEEKSSTLLEEKERLKQEKLQLSQESEILKEEKEKLATELQALKSTVGIASKPIYSKAYYEQRLIELEQELKDAQRELRLNAREFKPLQRVKKSYDRDIVKLRRKEAIVAKQKVDIYGVNNPDKVNSEKVAKLEEEVENLRKLKESVYHCEQVLALNKDRYPVLERINKIITRHINTIKNDIEQTKKSLAWFEENEKDDNK